MKRIAFVGHSYHKKTKSFDFFTEVLEHLFVVDFFFDETWAGGTPLDISAIGVFQYDVIILWQQINYVLHPDIDKHPNVILIPMFDCHAQNLSEFQRFISNTNLKFINFCRAQHEACIQYGLNSLSAQYFPKPEKFDSNRNYDELVGFFWPRRKEITWDMVAKLISKGQISRLFFHAAPDRGFPPAIPPEKARKQYQISISEWFDTKEELFQLLARANIYFAPRLYEGIGLSFLEAMAMGMCVVAPDTPTMNEYITHGVNGLLYDPDYPAPLDFSEVQRLGARARQSIEAGYKRWLKSIDDVLDFIAIEPADLRSTQLKAPVQKSLSKTSAPSTLRNLVSETGDAILPPQARLYGGLRTQGKVKKHTEEHPLITIATVTYDAEKELPGTLASILSQTYDNIELIIVDGDSTDGTLQIVKDNEQFIDLWISEPDKGPYDAMNKAAGLARGEWIFFLNAGDWFTDNNILEEIVKNSPRSADIIYGHHYYRHTNGNIFWHKANAFEWTHEMLRKGQLTNEWVKGIPGHQATLTRTSLLRKSGYDIERFSYASDHDFLFRMSKAGCTFHHADLTIAVYISGGFSWQNAADCMREQWRIARKYGPRRLVDQFYRKRIRHAKEEQDLLYSSFSEEWHPQEACFGGWMRWLPRTGYIKFQVEKSGEHLIHFQACSLLPDNTLTVESEGQVIFHGELSTKFSFFGPKQVAFEEGEHGFHFTSENEPSIPSLADPRLLGLAVKNFSVVEATSAARFRILLARFCSWFTNLVPGWLKSRFTAKFLHTLHLLKTYMIIWKSGLFSSKYYRKQYPETSGDEIKKPLQHYILKGAKERRNPNPLFDTGYYLDRNPDVAACGINPLYHYIICGAREGREPGPHISMAEYLEQNPNVDPKRINPLWHFMKNYLNT